MVAVGSSHAKAEPVAIQSLRACLGSDFDRRVQMNIQTSAPQLECDPYSSCAPMLVNVEEARVFQDCLFSALDGCLVAQAPNACLSAFEAVALEKTNAMRAMVEELIPRVDPLEFNELSRRLFERIVEGPLVETMPPETVQDLLALPYIADFGVDAAQLERATNAIVGAVVHRDRLKYFERQVRE